MNSVTSSERRHDASPPWHVLDGQQVKSGHLPFTIDRAPHGKKLLAHGSIGNKPNGSELGREQFSRPSARQFQKPRFELLVLSLLNPHTSVTVPMGNRITRELDRLTSGVTYLAGFAVEKSIVAVRGHEQKEPIMTDVVQVCEASALAACPLFA